MDKALLDTDIFSEVLKRKNKNVSGRAQTYRGRYGRFTLSAATVMEVVRGLCRLGAHSQLEKFLKALGETEIVPMDRDIAVLAGRIDGALSKAGTTIGINDVLIGATAIQSGLTLVTGNFEHYDRIVKHGFPLALDNWREPVGS
jgi:tRNA(fMet)-specific endonuclease VapC